MKIFLAGATGAIGSPPRARSRRRGPRGGRHDALPREGRALARSGRRAGRARRARRERRAGCGRRGRAGGRSCTRRPRSPRHERPPASSTRSSRRPTGCAPRAPTTCSRRRARGRRPPVRRAELRGLAVRAGGRAGEGRGRPARHRPAVGDARDARRDPPRRASGHGAERHRGHRAALRRLLRAGHVARGGRRARSRRCASAEVPDRRRRRRRLVVHPHRRRRGGDGRRDRARRARASTTSSTTSRRRSRSGCPALAAAVGAPPPRHVPAWLGRLVAGEAARRDDDRGPRRLEREGEARARLDASATRAGGRGLRPSSATEASGRRRGRSQGCATRRSRTRAACPAEEHPGSRSLVGGHFPK